jgi:teichuronic acid biosynthesis glycosyltransferase TuaH
MTNTAMTTNGSIDDLLITFSAVDSWDSAHRRGMVMPIDRVVERALEEPRVGNLLVADPYRNGAALLARRVAGQTAPFPRSDRHHRARPVRVLRRDSTSVAALERTYARYDAYLRRRAGRLGLERPAVITGNPFVAAFSELSWAGPVTYYAWDDWAAYPPLRDWWPAYEVAYERVRRSGRAVCAVSSPLLERLAPTGTSVVMPNALDPAEWTPRREPPDWMADLARPVILYVGTVDDRIDTAAVIDVAGRLDEGTVVVAGPVTNEAAILPLRSVPNVRLQPPVPRAQVPALVQGADVGIVPHRRTRLTEAMSPLKLYEFLAGGLPVVATDLRPMRGVDDRVVLVPDGESFAAGVETAVAMGPREERDRRAFVAANSWERRLETIFDLALAS